MVLVALDQTIMATVLPTVLSHLGGAGHQSRVVTSDIAPRRRRDPVSGGRQRCSRVNDPLPVNRSSRRDPWGQAFSTGAPRGPIRIVRAGRPVKTESAVPQFISQRKAASSSTVGVHAAGGAVSHTVRCDSSDDNDDESRASRHQHLHDSRPHIVPGRTIGLCLRIRRLGFESLRARNISE
jgi:hypothetical protein